MQCSIVLTYMITIVLQAFCLSTQKPLSTKYLSTTQVQLLDCFGNGNIFIFIEKLPNFRSAFLQYGNLLFLINNNKKLVLFHSTTE